jgi:hypothetical protein
MIPLLKTRLVYLKMIANVGLNRDLLLTSRDHLAPAAGANQRNIGRWERL